MDMVVDREGGDITAADMVTPQGSPGLISEFYAGSHILLVGGTSFLGHVLLEKLLRSCPKCAKIYVLIRPKAGKSIHDRFHVLFAGPLYDLMKTKVPHYRSKVVPIACDYAFPNLGISPEDRALLIREVDVVFHCSATIALDASLRTATYVNVRTTYDLATLAKNMKQLKSYVHVSTAYSNCPYREIDEKFYDPPMDFRKLLKVVDSLDDSNLSLITPSLLGSWPNTYTFTMAIAESVIRDIGLHLPVAIIRPSAVIATAREPVAGWLNNMHGPTGILVGVGTGLLRTLHYDANILADVVPNDFVVNAIIAIGWDIAETRKTTQNQEVCPIGQSAPIYNYVSSVRNPLTWKAYFRKAKEEQMHVPTMLQLWAIMFIGCRSQYLHSFLKFFLHTVCANLLDAACILFGKKPTLKTAYAKVHKFTELVHYFGIHQWKFLDCNTTMLFKRMTSADQTTFNFDISGMIWDEYFYTYIRGIRVFLLKDPLNTVPDAKRKAFVLTTMHYTICGILLYALCKVFESMFSLFGENE